MDLREYIRRQNQNNKWQQYVTSPHFYFFLEMAGSLWRPGKLNRHTKASLLFAIKLMRRASRGTRPVVWTNVYTPPELIWAWGGIPFMPEVAAAVAAHLGWSAHFLKVAEGAWYSTDLCSFHRCALGMAMEKILPRPDLVIATSHLCDGAVKFLEMSARIYDCPYYLLPVPYHDTPQSRSWLAEEILALQEELKPLLPARPKEIARVINNLNATRRHMLAVNALRKNEPAPWRGSEALTQVVLFLNGLGTAEALNFYRELEQVLSYRVKHGLPAVPEQERRLLWLHFKPFYISPLLDLVEIRHKSIIAFEEVSEVFWDEIHPDNYAGGIAAKMLANPLWGSGERRVGLVLRLAREYNAQGVVHFSHWGCRQSTGVVTPLRDALGKAGVPFLNLDGDCIDPRNFMEGQTVTRVESFLEMLC
ncbi:MAG: 2-hydroxyacyl-CoA dehydratase family protein [Bacillota bacterium]